MNQESDTKSFKLLPMFVGLAIGILLFYSHNIEKTVTRIERNQNTDVAHEYTKVQIGISSCEYLASRPIGYTNWAVVTHFSECTNCFGARVNTSLLSKWNIYAPSPTTNLLRTYNSSI